MVFNAKSRSVKVRKIHLIMINQSIYNQKKDINMKKISVLLFLMMISLGATANMKCVKNPNEIAPRVNGEQQGQMTMDMYAKKQNPVMDLMACANMTDFKSVRDVFKECGC